MNAAMLMLVATTFTTPAPAPAPAPNPVVTQSLKLGSHTTFVSPDAAIQAKQRGSVGGKAVFIDIQGGIAFNFGTGFFVGVGASFTPGSNDKISIMGDFNFGRVGGVNGYYISFNGLFNLKPTSSGMVPFVGAGIYIIHFGVTVDLGEFGHFSASGTATGLQIIAGIKMKADTAHPIKLSVRLGLGNGTPIIIIFGYGF